MIEWIQEHAWIMLWILITPLIMFIGIIHYILISFQNMKLNDWDWDEDDVEEFHE